MHDRLRRGVIQRNVPNELVVTNGHPCRNRRRTGEKTDKVPSGKENRVAVHLPNPSCNSDHAIEVVVAPLPDLHSTEFDARATLAPASRPAIRAHARATAELRLWFAACAPDVFHQSIPTSMQRWGPVRRLRLLSAGSEPSSIRCSAQNAECAFGSATPNSARLSGSTRPGFSDQSQLRNGWSTPAGWPPPGREDSL